MIPFLDLKRIHLPLRSEILERVGKIIDESDFVLGKTVLDFEEEFAKLNQSKYCVGVNSGTSALFLALLSLGVGPGDEVVVPAMTFIATAAAVSYTGAKPVFVDVDESTWTMTSEAFSSAITPNTKAVIPVHLHGLMADMVEIQRVAKRFGIFVIEDAAQAHLSAIENRMPGSFSDIACFSFYPGKNLGALGEGGAIVTEDESLVEKLNMLRNWGSKNKYVHEIVAFNARIEAIQAAALSIKIPYLRDWTKKRQDAAQKYDEAFKETNLGRSQTPNQFTHVHHIYAVRCTDRTKMIGKLVEKEIGYGIHYPIPLHLQPAYKGLNYGVGDFPISESLGAELLSLPLFPGITNAEIDEVVETLVT